MNNKTLIGILIFSAVIIVAVVIFIVIVKDSVFLSKGIGNSTASNSLCLVDTDGNMKVYVNTNGEVVKFDEYSSMSNFSYGSALVEKDDKKFIINSTGKIIVPSDKYDSIKIISNIGLNYIAEKEEQYAILDYLGKEITEFKYSWISTVRECDKIYEIEDCGKTGYISVTGKVLIEPLYDEEDLKCFADTDSNMLVIKVKNNYKVYDLNDYSLKYEITSSNVHVSIEDKYIYDIDAKTIYLFNKDIDYKAKLNVDIKDEIENGWISGYESIFEPYTDYGYLIYKNKEGKSVLVALDGKTLETGYFNFSMGTDYIFLYNYDSSINDDSVKIYNGSILKKTLKEHSIETNAIVNNDLALVKIPLECFFCDDTYKLFDKDGNLKFDDEKFERKSHYNNEYMIYVGESKIVLPSGNVVNIGENKFSSLIYDCSKEEYTEEYIVVEEEGIYKLIDKSNNVITEIGNADEYSMFSDVGIILYRDRDTNKYYVLDYINKNTLFESAYEIKYLDGYKCFSTQNWSNNDYNGVLIYSLKGELIYSRKGE